jgi:Fe-S cluster biogenesis protein NfuA
VVFQKATGFRGRDWRHYKDSKNQNLNLPYIFLPPNNTTSLEPTCTLYVSTANYLLSLITVLLMVMASRRITRLANGLLLKNKQTSPSTSIHGRIQINQPARCVHQSARLPAIAASNSRARPTLQPLHQPTLLLNPAASAGGSRTMFIQTENTPNPDARKFLPNHGQPILPEGLSAPFIEYLNPRSTLSPPHPSPLAASLMNIDGVTAVFYGADFITITKAADVKWEHVQSQVFSLITEAISSGAAIVNVAENKSGQDAPEEQDSLSYNENDSEVVGMIKELLETRIRPAIQEDGGDIEFRGFEGGNVMLKLRGACRTCDSSTVTLKNGIESMLMHYVRKAEILTTCLAGNLTYVADRRSPGSSAGPRPRRRDCSGRVCKV